MGGELCWYLEAQGRLAHMEAKISQVMGKLQTIVEHTGNRLTATQIESADCLDRMDASIERLTSRVDEVTQFLGLSNEGIEQNPRTMAAQMSTWYERFEPLPSPPPSTSNTIDTHAAPSFANIPLATSATESAIQLAMSQITSKTAVTDMAQHLAGRAMSEAAPLPLSEAQIHWHHIKCPRQRLLLPELSRHTGCPLKCPLMPCPCWHP